MMKQIDIEKLNQLISRTDINGNDKVRWLTDFIDGREFEQQERSYSEENLKVLIDYTRRWGSQSSDEYILKEWFNEFKKL